METRHRTVARHVSQDAATGHLSANTPTFVFFALHLSQAFQTRHFRVDACFFAFV